MIYTVRIDNKEYEVEVERGKANLLKTTDLAAPVQQAAPVQATPAAPAAAAQAASAPVVSAGANVITAPMPGTILDIKAAPGKSVKKGELLLILEAMKMENEIFAPADGVVAAVLTTTGAAVNTGDALLSMQ